MAVSTIAIIDSSREIVEVIAAILEVAGFRTVEHVSSFDEDSSSVVELLTTYRPAACICNVSYPYSSSWPAFQALQQHLPRQSFIVTTTNERELRNLVGPLDGLAVLPNRSICRS